MIDSSNKKQGLLVQLTMGDLSVGNFLTEINAIGS